MTKISAKGAQQFSARFLRLMIFAVKNPCKNSSMSGGGTWRGQRRFIGQHKCSKGCFQAAFAHIGCLIGCERNISDLENPTVEDSSSLSAEFHIQIVPCPGAGHGGQQIHFRWLDHALDNAMCFTLTSCNDQNFRDTFTVLRF